MVRKLKECVKIAYICTREDQYVYRDASFLLENNVYLTHAIIGIQKGEEGN